MGEVAPGLSTTLINLLHNCSVFNLKYILNKTIVTAKRATFFVLGSDNGTLKVAMKIENSDEVRAPVFGYNRKPIGKISQRISQCLVITLL